MKPAPPVRSRRRPVREGRRGSLTITVALHAVPDVRHGAVS